MSKKKNRIGEEKLNNFGSKMKIIEYRNANDIDIYFEEYNWVAKNKCYKDFNIGNIKCPYEPRVWGKGYIGEGKYITTINKRPTKMYNTWHGMLERCYSINSLKLKPTYEKCEVCKEWLCFQNFAKWYEENYYDIDNEQMCLDKDILVKGNKIYSSETCIFVPQFINKLFTKCDKSRGKYPIGVSYHKGSEKFISRCQTLNGCEYIGSFENSTNAFLSYKNFKEKYIKELAEEYKQKIPNKLYVAMINYKVEITD